MRALELQADAAAVPAMARVSFDPAALLRYLERLRTPAIDERIAALQQVLREFPQTSSTTSDAFTAIQQQVRAQLPSRPKPSLRRQ
jgi:predicted Zn-dependent protease